MVVTLRFFKFMGIPNAAHELLVHGASGSITIPETLNDSIKGTLNGELWNSATANFVTISDGRFAVLRGEDQQ